MISYTAPADRALGAISDARSSTRRALALAQQQGAAVGVVVALQDGLDALDTAYQAIEDALDRYHPDPR